MYCLFDELLLKKEWDVYLEAKERHSDKKIDIYKSFVNRYGYRSYIRLYRANLLKQLPIPVRKKVAKGKGRIVYSFGDNFNFFLGMVANKMTKRYDELFAPNLFSYRRFVGVKEALLTILKKKDLHCLYVYKVDISKYFYSIDIGTLFDSSLNEDLSDPELYEFLKSLFIDKKVRRYIKSKKAVIEFDEEKGVMAGTPVSGFLANYYLKDMDWDFYNNKIDYIRYADDIVVFAKTRRELDEHIDRIKKWVQVKKLKINGEKEFIYSPSDVIDFLGVEIGYNSKTDNKVVRVRRSKIEKTISDMRKDAKFFFSKGLNRWKDYRKSKYGIEAVADFLIGCGELDKARSMGLLDEGDNPVKVNKITYLIEHGFDFTGGFIRKYETKFFGGVDEFGDLGELDNIQRERSWRSWYFPIINTNDGFKEIDECYMDCIRYIYRRVLGCKWKKNKHGSLLHNNVQIHSLVVEYRKYVNYKKKKKDDDTAGSGVVERRRAHEVTHMGKNRCDARS